MHPPLFGMTVIVSALWEICCAGDDVRAESLGFGFGVGDDPDAPVGLNIEGGMGEAQSFPGKMLLLIGADAPIYPSGVRLNASTTPGAKSPLPPFPKR